MAKHLHHLTCGVAVDVPLTLSSLFIAQFFLIKNEFVALAGVAQVIAALLHNQKIVVLIPSQSTDLGCGFHP